MLQVKKIPLGNRRFSIFKPLTLGHAVAEQAEHAVRLYQRFCIGLQESLGSDLCSGPPQEKIARYAAEIRRRRCSDFHYSGDRGPISERT